MNTNSNSNANSIDTSINASGISDNPAIYNKHKTDKPIYQAHMIPTPHQTKLIPVIIISSVRQTKTKKPPLLSTRLPQPENYEQLPYTRLNKEDIQLLGATSFLQFCH